MKLTTILLLFFCTAMQAETISWYGSFKSALYTAKNKNRPIFVVVVERNCDECRQLFAGTLREERIVREINEKTVPVIVTKEDENYPVELLYTLVYPTIFLLSPQEVIVKPPISGAIDANLLEKKIFDE